MKSISPWKAWRIASLLVFTALAFGWVVWGSPPVLWLRYSHMPCCGFLATVQGTIESLRTKQRFVHIEKAARLIGTEGALEYWAVDQDRYWIHRDSRDRLFFSLAEQYVNPYATPAVHVWPGDIVLDCGAYVGTFARVALAAGAALVIAIEPEKLAVECLRRNLQPGLAKGRAIVREQGVWDKEESAPLYTVPGGSLGNSLVFRNGRPEKQIVSLTTIDQLVRELGLPRVDFIKFDIEGAELPALRGAQSTIAAHRPRLAISLYHLPDDWSAIPKEVRRIWSGYRMIPRICGPRHRRIVPTVGLFY